MYGWIFRHLPGPLWVRILISILLIAAIVYALMEYVFPHFAQYGPFNLDVTIDPGSSSPSASPTSR